MLWRLESHLTYKPTQVDYGGFQRARPLTEAFINDDLQNKIHLAYNTADSSKVIVFAHGRDGNMTKFSRYYGVLDALGYSYLTFDYPGFGRSSGIPTENNLYSSARAATAFAKKIFGVDDDRIVLFGLSLGAAIVLEIAQEMKAHRIVLESPFTSSRDMGRFILGARLPLYMLVPNRYRNSEKIVRIETPILIFNGTADRRVPAHHSNALFDSKGGPRTLVTYKDAGHLDLVDKLASNYPDFIREFIDSGRLKVRREPGEMTIQNSLADEPATVPTKV